MDVDVNIQLFDPACSQLNPVLVICCKTLIELQELNHMVSSLSVALSSTAKTHINKETF